MYFCTDCHKNFTCYKCYQEHICDCNHNHCEKDQVLKVHNLLNCELSKSLKKEPILLLKKRIESIKAPYLGCVSDEDRKIQYNAFTEFYLLMDIEVSNYAHLLNYRGKSMKNTISVTDKDGCLIYTNTLQLNESGVFNYHYNYNIFDIYKAYTSWVSGNISFKNVNERNLVSKVIRCKNKKYSTIKYGKILFSAKYTPGSATNSTEDTTTSLTITGVSPSSSPPGTLLTITGSGFVNQDTEEYDGYSFSFNNGYFTNATYISSTEIQVTSAANCYGNPLLTYYINNISGDIISTSTSDYYTETVPTNPPPPVLTSVYNVNYEITLNGNNFGTVIDNVIINMIQTQPPPLNKNIIINLPIIIFLTNEKIIFEYKVTFGGTYEVSVSVNGVYPYPNTPLTFNT